MTLSLTKLLMTARLGMPGAIRRRFRRQPAMRPG